VTFAPDTLLGTILDFTADAVLVSNGDGVIVYVNTPLLELFGYGAVDLVGRHVEVLLANSLDEDDGDSITKLLRATTAGPMTTDDLDLEGLRADGSRFPIEVHLNALPGSALVVGTVRDMTTHRRSSVDSAIAKIDLANALRRIEQLQDSLDLVIQRLFALGTSIVASATNEDLLAQRMEHAVQGIDEVIEAVQQHRQAPIPS
jgi:PAS domain S-box-containing protein